jgi:hypothetical protein
VEASDAARAKNRSTHFSTRGAATVDAFPPDSTLEPHPAATNATARTTEKRIAPSLRNFLPPFRNFSGSISATAPGLWTLP